MVRYRVIPPERPEAGWQSRVDRWPGVRIVGFGRILTVETDAPAADALARALGAGFSVEPRDP
jgi:hypothetical protein